MLQLSSVAQVSAHRTLSPLYEQYQATPIATFLDPNETENIYSGQVMYRTGPDTVALCDGGASGVMPFGLSALDRNPNIDDWTQTNNNSWTVWVGGVNAYFQITSPAFDVNQSYTVSTTGTHVGLYAGTTTAKGMLTSTAGSGGTAGAVPVAELIDVLSPTIIVVRLVPYGTSF